MAANNLRELLYGPAQNNALAATPLLPVKTTALPPHLENMYKSWVMQNRIPESNDYDMRGFFMDMLKGSKDAQTSINPSDMQLHFTDKWKLPNHPAFSQESKYSMTNQDPRWVGNFIDDSGKQHWNASPYIMDTWARQNKTGNLNVEIPQ